MYKEYEKLKVQKGVTDYEVSKETGISPSTLSEWKTGKYQPKVDKLIAIANYFNVPVDVLLKKNE